MTLPPTRSRLAVLAVIGVVAVAVVAPTTTGPASADDTSTCHGLATTMVVEAKNGSADGTAGDDVVVVVGSYPTDELYLQTRGGNDTICFMGVEGFDLIDAGEGDDYVSTVGGVVGGENTNTRTILGPGADTFVGGPARDVVEPGTTAEATADMIDLGAGDDTFVVKEALPTTPVVGGPGTDRLALSVSGATSVSDVTHTLTARGVTGSFAPDFEVFAFDGPGQETFQGGDGAERVVAINNLASGSLAAEMGGGDDVIEVNESVGGTWSGGAGVDQLVGYPYGRVDRRPGQPAVTIDLAKGTYRAGRQRSAVVDGLESVALQGYDSVRVLGSGADETFDVNTCTADIAGRGGADTVTFVRSRYGCRRSPGQLTARGGAGDDRITGDRGNDVLRGGPGDDVLIGRGGRDTAYGDAGRDHCVAERRISC